MPSACAGIYPSWPRPAALPLSPFPLIILALLLALLLGAPLSALAQDSALSGQRLAASCANCHGTLGNPADASFAPLAGMPAATLIGSMRAFRDGSRPATVMHQLAKGFTDDQVKLIADFYAGQKAGQNREAQ